MFIKEYMTKVDIDEKILEKYNMKEIAYFDIETTGFDKEEDRVILISLGRYTEQNAFAIKQYFAEKLEDEIEVLYEFEKDLHTFHKWCSYNGIAFDEPFIKRRMQRNSIPFQAPGEHIDLYRSIRPYHKQLGMERCNLKTVEKYLGILRQDQIDGELSVRLYNEFLQYGEEKIKELLMLHNYEDVLNLPHIFKLVYEVKGNATIVRPDGITEKQIKFLKSLLEKNEINLEIDVEKISKKAAARMIDTLLKGQTELTTLVKISSNSY